ncbi:dTDP-4-dehydrorhamnose reductase [Neptunicella sp.]|uniref:dTDP-4-dehydrorhamnose reductase n=1 Tax=Neptunicella sp. TaxID=2125986 RepID=UPI003F693E71
MIIVIGKSGQLALAIRKIAADREILFLGRHDIDITTIDNIELTLKHFRPVAIINASAYTAVDRAETDAEQAYLLNETAVANLARYCAKRAIHFVHVSTDYVFAGNKGSPYLTDDDYGPKSVYGSSKMAGEIAMLKYCPNACIIRTSWVYSSEGQNFVKTMLRLMREKSELGVIDDQIGSPTSANALAKACLVAAEKKVVGIHHFTDAGVASWYDFANTIQQLAHQKGLLSTLIPINPIPTRAYPTPAQRPAYSVLDKSSLKESFNLQPKHWQSELTMVLDELCQIKTD